MGTLLDAYPLIALLADEPPASEVALVLGQGDISITSVNLGEALDVLERVHGVPERVLRGAIETLAAAGLAVVPVLDAEAWRAAALRARHYRRRVSEISLADCFLLAVARPGDRVATSDRPLARAARAEGIDVIALPDSRGRRP